MLGAERRFMTGERDPRQVEGFRSPPAKDQCKSQLAAPAIGLRVTETKALDRSGQQILAGEDRLGSLVLGIQRGLEGFAIDDTQRDQVFADPSAEAFLARQGILDVLFPSQTLRDQKFTEKHNGTRIRSTLRYLIAITAKINSLHHR